VTNIASQSNSKFPVLVFVGPLEKLESFHVLVGVDILYTYTSVLDAVDFAFKLFFSIDVQYPPVAYQVWIFVQIVFYNLKTSADVISRGTEFLITELSSS